MAEGEDSSTNSLEVCPTSRQHALIFVGESSLPQKFSVQDEEAQRPAFGGPDSITLIVFSVHAFVVSQSNWPERKETEMKETHLTNLNWRSAGGSAIARLSGGAGRARGRSSSRWAAGWSIACPTLRNTSSRLSDPAPPTPASISKRARDHSSRMAVDRGAAAIPSLSLACRPYQFRLNPHRFSVSLVENPETGRT